MICSLLQEAAKLNFQYLHSLKSKLPLYRMLNTTKRTNQSAISRISYRAFTLASRYPSTANALAVVAAVIAAILAATTAVLDEGDIAVGATIAVEEGFTDVGVVGGLVGSREGAVDLGSVLACGAGRH